MLGSITSRCYLREIEPKVVHTVIGQFTGRILRYGRWTLKKCVPRVLNPYFTIQIFYFFSRFIAHTLRTWVKNWRQKAWSFLLYQPQAQLTKSFHKVLASRFSSRDKFNPEIVWFISVLSTFSVQVISSISSLFFCNQARDYRFHFNQWNQIVLLTLIIYTDRCRTNGPNNSQYHLHACHNILYFDAVSIP